MSDARHERLRNMVRDTLPALGAVGVVAVDADLPNEPPIASRRRRRLQGDQERQVRYLSLVEDDHGVLEWQVDAGPAVRPAVRRAGRRTGPVIEQIKLEPVSGSDIAQFLAGLDTTFNPLTGLYRWNGRAYAPCAAPAAKGRVLLIVHGTFSKCDALLDQLRSHPEGRAFLKQALAHYDEVLAFQHPTLSVSPMLNAFDLARVFRDTKAEVDIVCHSRGGLVVRWWLEALNANAALKARAVFVGAPLQGTSLASPAKLRAALKLLTNVAATLGTAGKAASLVMPMFGVVTGLASLMGATTRIIGGTPVVDAALAMVPGLAAQARYGAEGAQFLSGNFELERLSGATANIPASYSFVKSSFVPRDPGWKFWEYFTDTRSRLGPGIAKLGADVVFQAAHDLVVDTDSMTRLAPAHQAPAAANVLDFGENAAVHHLNYFSEPRLGAFLAARFGMR